MNQPASSRLGAACGAVFAIVLFAANGDGSQPFSGPRAVAGIAALTLAIPFLCYLCRTLREGEGAHGWLAGTALAAGITGITLKLASGAPELALQRAHVAAGTELHASLGAVADAATLLSLYPLAVSARPPRSSPSAPASCRDGSPRGPRPARRRSRSTASSSPPAPSPPCCC